MCIVVTLCLVVKKQKHNILVLSPLSITRLIYIKQNLMNRLSVSDDFHRLIILWGVNEAPYHFPMGPDPPKCLNSKVPKKKKTSCGRKFTKPSGILVLRVHVLCGCGDLRRSGLINVFFWEEVVELVVNLATPLVICKFKFV